MLLIHRNRRTDPMACTLQSEIWHVLGPLPLFQGSVLSGGQCFPPATVLHIPAPALPGNPRERWLGDSSPVTVFLKNSFRNFQARWNELTGFPMAITPILRNPFTLPRSRADTHNLHEQRRAGKELKKAIFSFIQKHFHLPITFHRSNFTSWSIT